MLVIVGYSVCMHALLFNIKNEYLMSKKRLFSSYVSADHVKKIKQTDINYKNTILFLYPIHIYYVANNMNTKQCVLKNGFCFHFLKFFFFCK